ncbi:serine/threonine protein kinase [Moumouvirus australiensis]|uniref:Serine/threonine protein kinase n=1 Tax=Moumouvirus australiensis TaxID=2109587 RepID=A0A2P1EL22_9VIRU|nr:serine/threonine protein kinase [Moumouvirus australiensis]AVL94567.1 serine/threonine protein kinase [Moumouvirus australiensis]
MERLSHLSKNDVKRLSRCQSKDIDKNVISSLLASNIYLNKNRLQNISNIHQIGGVQKWEFNLQEINKNNNNLKDSFPWDKNVSYKILRDILNQRYQNINTLLLNLLTIDEDGNIDISFLENFYLRFYIGNYQDKNICEIMKIFNKTSGKIQTDNYNKIRTVGSGSAGKAFLVESLNGNYEIVFKKMGNIKQYRNKFLELGVILCKYDAPLKSFPTNKYFEYFAQDIVSVVESRNSGYSFYNAFISGQGDGLIYLNCSNDNFTNQTIMHIVLDNILSQYYNDHYIYQYDAFFCENRSNIKIGTSSIINAATLGYSPKTNVRQVDGYSILEFANAGSLYDIIEDISTVFINIEENYENLSFIFNDIFVQVLKTLQILQQPKYSFVHGDLKTKNIFVSFNNYIKLPQKYTNQVNDTTSKFPQYIYKIADYDKSSITWNGVRFYNSGNIATNLVHKIFNDIFLLNLTSLTNGDFYVLTNILPVVEKCSNLLGNIEIESILIRYSPIPFYTSIDVYSFIISMMLHKLFYQFVQYSIKNSISNEIVQILKILFNEIDFIILLEYFDNYHSSPNKIDNGDYGQIIKIIKNKHINLRKNINEVYNIYGLTIQNTEERNQTLYLDIGKNGNICVNNCDNDLCKVSRTINNLIPFNECRKSGREYTIYESDYKTKDKINNIVKRIISIDR